MSVSALFNFLQLAGVDVALVRKTVQGYEIGLNNGETRAATPEELTGFARAQITDLIRSEARRRILARIPDWMQANMTARAVQLVQLGQTDGAEWAAMQAAWGWVQATRQHSNDLTVKAVASDDPLAFDYSGGWPA